MARVVVVGGGFGGLAAPRGWPSSATRSPCSRAPTALGGAVGTSSRTGSAGTRARRTRCCRPWCATSSASPGGRWSRSSTWCRSSRSASTGSTTASCSTCRAAAARRSSRRSTRPRRRARAALGGHVASFADDWEVLRRDYLEKPCSAEHASCTPALLSTAADAAQAAAEDVQGRAAARRGARTRSRRGPRPAQRAGVGRDVDLRRAAVRRLDGPGRHGPARPTRSSSGWRPAGSPC